MKGLRWAAGAFAAVMLALLVLPPFVPLESRRARLAEMATARLDEPVKIGKVTASLFPMPHFTASDVSIGHDDGVKIGSVMIRPRVTSLFGERTVVRNVEFADVTTSASGLRRLMALLAPSDTDRRGIDVENIALKNVVMTTLRSEVGPLDGDVAMAPQRGLARATLRTTDGKLHAEVVPDGDDYAITVEAKEWTLPWGPALAFQSLRMTGSATHNEARFRDVVAQAYGGTAQGELKLSWKDGLRLSGDLTLKRVELAALLDAFSAKSRITGRLDAKPAFRMHGVDATELAHALHLEGPFDVHGAVLHGVDLQAAASLVKQGERNRDTRFDELSGELVLDGKAYRYTKLKATSGALAARGEVGLSAKKALSGKVYAQLQAVGAAAEVPLNVSGTLDAPVISPTAASVAGAAVGTAVLGPVLGTSVGAKIGDVADKLFSGADERK